MLGQAHGSINAPAGFLETAPMIGVPHQISSLGRVHGLVSASLRSLADLLLGRVLALVGQVVRVSVLRGDLLYRVAELGGIHPQPALVDLILEHLTGVFLVHEFLHARRAQPLISEGCVLFALRCPFENDFVSAILRLRICCSFLALLYNTES